MSVDLTLFLLKSTVTTLEGVIPEEKCGVEGFVEVPSRDNFPSDEGFACWVKKNEPRPTDWSAWLEQGFSFGSMRPETASSGCVVLLTSVGRVFAACFGIGWHAIPDELIEYDFGLTVALNEVNPKQVRTLVTKTIDARTRQRDTHQTSGAEVPDFAIDLDVEWLRSAEGRTERDDCNVVAGAQALKLRGWKRPLHELPAACAEFYSSFQKGTPEAFKFADAIKPIPESDPLHGALEGDLEAALQLRFFEVLAVGIDPKIVHEAHQFVLTYGKKEWVLEGIDEDSLVKGLDQLVAHDADFQLSKARIRVLDVEGDEIDDSRLGELVQMEIDRGEDTFVRIERRWFRCQADYMERVSQRVAALPDLTTHLLLPSWTTAMPKEENYNLAVAANKGWLLQDQMFYWRNGEKIEPCDLLTPDKHFIHVKDGGSSSALSHLFGQASGSADLLIRHTPYRDEMKRRYEGQWPGTTFEASRATVVLGIARATGTDLFGKMLLSRINVLEHARRIQNLGLGFAIYRIDRP